MLIKIKNTQPITRRVLSIIEAITYHSIIDILPSGPILSLPRAVHKTVQVGVQTMQGVGVYRLDSRSRGLTLAAPNTQYKAYIVLCGVIVCFCWFHYM